MKKTDLHALFTDKEIWKPVPCYVSVEASSLGNIRHSGTHELYNLSVNGDGYYLTRVHPSIPTATSKMVYAHALVMKAFVGDTPDGQCIGRRNADKLDNRLFNLFFRKKGKVKKA